MSSSSSASVGMKLILSVDEPWDFRTPNGDNVVTTSLERIIDDKTWLIVASSPVSVAGLTGCLMIVHPRYTGHVLADSFGPDGAVVGVALFAGATDVPVDEAMRGEPKYVIIGSLYARASVPST